MDVEHVFVQSLLLRHKTVRWRGSGGRLARPAVDVARIIIIEDFVAKANAHVGVAQRVLHVTGKNVPFFVDGQERRDDVPNIVRRR